MKIKVNKSTNFSKKTRSLRDIKYLIIHYTGMQSARVSMKRLKNPKSKVTIVPLQVAEERVAVTVRVCAKEKFATNKKINVKLFNFNKIYT